MTTRPTRPHRLPEYATAWGMELANDLPSASFGAVQANPSHLRDWLSYVRRYGFAVLRDGPLAPAAVFDVVALFGFVRETNYGKLFDVRTEINPSNLAFTGLPLSPHTDNPYRDPAPTIQVLYCLENSATGGASTVVDGFAVAERLAKEFPKAFELLSRYPVNFEFAGTDSVWLKAKKPIVEVSADGRLVGVRYNNRSIGAITTVPLRSNGAVLRSDANLRDAGELTRVHRHVSLGAGRVLCGRQHSRFARTDRL